MNTAARAIALAAALLALQCGHPGRNGQSSFRYEWLCRISGRRPLIIHLFSAAGLDGSCGIIDRDWSHPFKVGCMAGDFWVPLFFAAAFICM